MSWAKALFCMLIYCTLSFANQTPNWETAGSIYEFTVNDIHGKEVNLSKYKGRVVIIVNVASKCGYTDRHYSEFNVLYEKYHDKGLDILAFPCNQFGYQEPGSHEDICGFVESIGVKFDMFSKVNVNGEDAHPLFKYLKMKQGGTLGDFIKWNFTKFIINRNGQPVERHSPNVSPLDIEPTILDLLNQSNNEPPAKEL